jgi:hypothetical protein
MDIKTLLNPPPEDSGYGLTNDGESIAWGRHTKVDRQIYKYGTDELEKRSANDPLHRRTREGTSTRQGSLHFHSSRHGEVFDRDGDESTYASTHKSSISRSSFSSFTSTSPSVSGTSSSLYPEQDRSFPSPPLPPHTKLQSRATYPTETRLLSSVDAVGFSTTSYMAQSPPRLTARASFPTIDYREWPLSSASEAHLRYIPSSVMAMTEPTLADSVSIATAGDWEINHKGLKQTQCRQESDSAHVSSEQSYAGLQEPQQQKLTNALNNTASSLADSHNSNTHARLEHTEEAKDSYALDRAEKSESGSTQSVTPNYGHKRQL